MERVYYSVGEANTNDISCYNVYIQMAVTYINRSPFNFIF